jgi:predicted nucleotidyltransferase
MSHTEILKILTAFKERCAERYGIISLGLFGSAARDKSRADSDVDIVIKLKKQDLFNMIGIKQDLEEKLHTSVDVISYRETMNAFLKNRIDKEAIYV